ncbi:unnamed protein product [Owenia fusiformis]|uniref:Glycosyltransferase family 92 protein n=1 Tax=Owenia fusiformis TaxID=6347 RepID=A0A8J1V0H1_OWEFU|nr:unnamed protein product [Owenia fusiformis]
MGKCRVYMICTFLAYLLFIVMLHTQLELFDITPNDTLIYGSVHEKQFDTYKQRETYKEDTLDNKVTVTTNVTRYQHTVIQNQPKSEVTEKIIKFNKKINLSSSQYEFPLTEECNKTEDTKNPLYFRELYPMLYLYSAYYDERVKETDGQHYIRLISLVKKHHRINLFCHFELQGQQNLKSKYVWTEVEYYEMCENHGKKFGGYILSCKVPREELGHIPCSVTISSVHPLNPTVPNLTIPIFSLSQENMTHPKKDFGVCIPPLFGDQDVTKIVQFIELTRILGASHFILYIAEIKNELLQILQYYEYIGILTLIQWKMPVQSKMVWYNGQLLAINDCLYRSMRYFKHVIFNDLDEFLVPRGVVNWNSMVKQLQQNYTNRNDIAGFSFKSAFFPINTGLQTKGTFHHIDITQRVITLSSVRRKVMVNPRNIFELGIHHISRPFAMRHHGIAVNEKYAILHHYRKCTSEFDNEMKCKRLVKDSTILKYANELKQNVNAVMNDYRETMKYVSISRNLSTISVIL